MTQVTGTFTGTGQSGTLTVTKADFTLSLDFAGTATVKLQRSFDSGTTWKDVKEYTASVEENGFEPASGVQYRLNCTAYTDDVVYVLGTHE